MINIPEGVATHCGQLAIYRYLFDENQMLSHKLFVFLADEIQSIRFDSRRHNGGEEQILVSFFFSDVFIYVRRVHTEDNITAAEA